MTPREFVFARAGAGRRLAIAGDVYRCVVSGDQTNGSYAVIEATVPPGGGPPLHVHTHEEEGFLVLEGEVTFRTDECSIRARPGDFINLPPGVRHRFQNDAASAARLLIVVSPPGLERMFDELGVVLDDATASAPAVTREELERIMRVAPKYGITLFPPSEDS